MLKARKLKATPEEITELTRMMNNERANERFFEEMWKPVLRERKLKR